MRSVPGLLLAAVTAACAAPRAPGTTPEEWVATWSAAPQLTEPRNMPPAPFLGENTLRQTLRVSIGGPRVRVHFSNEYGASPLRIRSARLARHAGAGRTVPGTERALSFDGRDGVIIAAGAVAVSDPIEYAVEPLGRLAVTIAFGDVPADLTGHPGSRTTSYLAPPAAFDGPSVDGAVEPLGRLAVTIAFGDVPADLTGHPGSRTTSYLAPPPGLDGPSVDGAVETDHWYVLTGIDVAAPGAAAVAVLGNSITDGRGSTTNGNDRWTDVLSERLRARPGTRQVAVLNAGIGGNCVLGDCLGPPGLARFQRDVLEQAGVRWAVIFEGINDIGSAAGPAEADSIATALIGAYQEMIRRGHDRGLRVYGATLLPFAGSGYWTPAREAARRRVNRWIRTGGAFDAVLDFETALRDPADPTRLRPDADTGDHLHPDTAGHRLMAEAVDLSLFETAARRLDPG